MGAQRNPKCATQARGAARTHPHDAPKDVHQDGLHARVRVEDLKGARDLVGAGAAAHVQKVGGRAAVQLDDVHGGHGQPRAVDHAANAAVQAHVVEPRLLCRHVARVLHALVALRKDGLLAEGGVVVKVQLGVHGKDGLAALAPGDAANGQRVDLHLPGPVGGKTQKGGRGGRRGCECPGAAGGEHS